MTREPIAYINVEKRTLEFAKQIFWHTPTVANIDRIPLFTKEALSQTEQKPVAWLLTEKNINSLQVDSIQRLIDRLKHAHHTDVCVRINGQDERFQADWLKHMVRVTPPQRTEQVCCQKYDTCLEPCTPRGEHLAQRTWVGLTRDEQSFVYSNLHNATSREDSFWVDFANAIEAKLKEKNNA